MISAISPAALRALLLGSAEFALLDQIKRDQTIRFRAYD